MSEKPLDLAVVESRWWKNGNSSVRGLFDVLADIHRDNPSAYHYEMFNNENSLREIVCRTSRRYRNLYIAAHGNGGSIWGAEARNRNQVSLEQLKDILNVASIQKRAKLRGLFVGSCGFVDEENAKYILTPKKKKAAKKSAVSWIAGYSKSIGWMDSSVVDLFFWNAYYSVSKRSSEKERIESIAGKIDKFMPGANKVLGFNIFLKRGWGNVEALLPIDRG